MIKVLILFRILMLHFLLCNGCSNLYTSIGQCRKPMSSTVLDTFSPISQTECENHCNNNSGCKGIGYTPGGIFGASSCELSSSSFYEIQFGFFCSTVFYVRHCPAGCLDSYTVYDQNTKGEGIIHVDTQKEKQCESLCNANSLCQGFRHDTSDNTCELTVGNIGTPSGSSGSRFYQRHCPKDCINSYSSPMGYSKSTAVYWDNDKATEAECQTACNTDSFCMAFYYRADLTLCQLSTSNNLEFWGFLGFGLCSSCNFYRRHCYGQAASSVTDGTGLETTTDDGVLTTLLDTKTVTMQETLSTSTTGLGQTTLSDFETSKTTEDTQTEILTTSTSPSTVNNSSFVQCVCSCRNSSMSLEENIVKRKKELQVNVDELSSSKRKLISVTDPRPSAQAIGHVGVGILVLVGCLFLVPDLFSGLAFIIRSYKF